MWTQGADVLLERTFPDSVFDELKGMGKHYSAATITISASHSTFLQHTKLFECYYARRAYSRTPLCSDGSIRPRAIVELLGLSRSSRRRESAYHWWWNEHGDVFRARQSIPINDRRLLLEGGRYAHGYGRRLCDDWCAL